MKPSVYKILKEGQDVAQKDTPARHIVLTIPKRLRVYPRYDRTVGDILFRAAWGSIKEVLGSAGATPAAVLTLQCSGEALNFHPHLHGCLADGLFAADGTFMPFKEIDQAKLTTCFAEAVLSGLHTSELIDDGVVSQILSQQHSGFSVWLGERRKKTPLLQSPPVEPPAKASSNWARCIKQIYEITPRECPSCKGTMRIIAFIQDPLEIKKIMASLGLPDFRAPPPLPVTPESAFSELPFDPIPDYDA